MEQRCKKWHQHHIKWVEQHWGKMIQASDKMSGVGSDKTSGTTLEKMIPVPDKMSGAGFVKTSGVGKYSIYHEPFNILSKY